MDIDHAEQLALDIELINEIDETDVELPYGTCDWLEFQLLMLAGGEPLGERVRKKAEALIGFIRRKSE